MFQERWGKYGSVKQAIWINTNINLKGVYTEYVQYAQYESAARSRLTQHKYDILLFYRRWNNKPALEVLAPVSSHYAKLR